MYLNFIFSPEKPIIQSADVVKKAHNCLISLFMIGRINILQNDFEKSSRLPVTVQLKHARFAIALFSRTITMISAMTFRWILLFVISRHGHGRYQLEVTIAYDFDYLIELINCHLMCEILP
jgi:hypothetical protein